MKSIYILKKRNIYIHRQHDHLCTLSEAIYKKTTRTTKKIFLDHRI